MSSDSEKKTISTDPRNTAGPIQAKYYANKRGALPGEIEYWKSLVRPDQDIIEVGAGTGFISEAVAHAGPRQFFLIECAEPYVKILQKKMAHFPNVQIIPSRFQDCTPQQVDKIIFPYDTYPELPEIEKKELYQFAFKNLKSGGRFYINVATLESHRNSYGPITLNPLERKYTLENGNYIQSYTIAEYIAADKIRASHTVFEKRDNETLGSETYLLEIEYTNKDRMIELATQAKLRLVELITDFPLATKTNEEYIFIFEKP